MSIYNSEATLQNVTSSTISIGTINILPSSYLTFWDTKSENISENVTNSFAMLRSNEQLFMSYVMDGYLTVIQDGIILTYNQFMYVFDSMKNLMNQSLDMSKILSQTYQKVSVQNAALPIEMPKRQQDDSIKVTLVGRLGSEALYASHDFCDPTTWYSQSVRVVGEVATNPSNDLINYKVSHKNIIDMSHGKVYDEDSLCEDVEHAYCIKIFVDGYQKTQREAFEASGGDYDINYKDGYINFFEPLASNSVVTIDYSYENGSAWVLKPYTGKYLDIYKAKLQFTDDTIMTDTIHYEVWGYVDVFAPQYLQSNGGPLPSGTLVKIMNSCYKQVGQFIDEAESIGPRMDPIGGADRGFTNALKTINFGYETIRRLQSSYGMEMHARLDHDRHFTGERCTIAFRCISSNEPPPIGPGSV